MHIWVQTPISGIYEGIAMPPASSNDGAPITNIYSNIIATRNIYIYTLYFQQNPMLKCCVESFLFCFWMEHHPFSLMIFPPKHPGIIRGFPSGPSCLIIGGYCIPIMPPFLLVLNLDGRIPIIIIIIGFKKPIRYPQYSHHRWWFYHFGPFGG